MGATPTKSQTDRWITAFAWTVILGVVGFVAWMNTSGAGATAAAGVHWEMLARSILGMRGFTPSTASAARDLVDRMDTGTPEMRQRAAVLAGETEGAAAAGTRLEAFDAQARAAGGETAEVQRVLEALYPTRPPKDETQAARVGGLEGADRALLVRSLGWFGRLALAPDGGDQSAREAVMSAARRTAVVNISILGLVCALVPTGLVLLVVALVLRILGKLHVADDVAPDERSFGAETFAVFMALYVGMGVVARSLSLGDARWAFMIGAQALSFAVLIVPVARGLSWPTVRRRVGTHAGAGIAREVGAGVVAWIAGWPVVLAGVFAMFAVQKILHHDRTPGEGSHPITTLLSGASPADAVLIAVAAAVMAPLVEETMFRGVLYRHLRETTARAPRVVSVLVSAITVALLFAAVHPQGWTAVPVLGALAFNFALAREWRGSLVAPIVMHALNNVVAVVLVQVALSP